MSWDSYVHLLAILGPRASHQHTSPRRPENKQQVTCTIVHAHVYAAAVSDGFIKWDTLRRSFLCSFVHTRELGLLASSTRMSSSRFSLKCVSAPLLDRGCTATTLRECCRHGCAAVRRTTTDTASSRSPTEASHAPRVHTPQHRPIVCGSQGHQCGECGECGPDPPTFAVASRNSTPPLAF